MRRFYPDGGPLRRELYPGHLAFFAAGATHFERAIFGGNRTGKSTAAGYEFSLHLTGRYPGWWTGRRFAKPVVAWAASVDVKSMRAGAQEKLFYEKIGASELGTGLIPGDDIIGTPTAQRGTAEAYDTARIRHVSGGVSSLTFKTYEQGRESFQAAAVDVGWCDEEPPRSIYTEFLTRLMSTTPGVPNGTMMCTMTPLLGMSDVVRYLLGEGWAEAV